MDTHLPDIKGDIAQPNRTDIDPNFLAGIIDSSEDAIISKDLNGRITSWNDTAAKMFGYTRDEIIGQSVTLLIPHERLNEEDNILDNIRNGKRISHFETKRVRKDGVQLDISLTISPIKDENGTIIGASKIARDITEQVSIRKKLEEYTEQLETLNQHKDEFMSLASHELKTPLTSAKAYIQLLNKIIEPHSKASLLAQKAGMSIIRLESLINDLLDLSKIQDGKLVYNMEPLNLMDIVQNSTESVQHFSDTHRIEIMAINDVMLHGDRVRLEQMLNYLLTNAIKYSPQAHRVEVAFTIEGDSVVISIRDFGIGIPEGARIHLTERHYRADNASNRFSGLGLGLYITHEIISRHSGKLWVESAVDQGSIFYVRLPIH